MAAGEAPGRSRRGWKGKRGRREVGARPSPAAEADSFWGVELRRLQRVRPPHLADEREGRGGRGLVEGWGMPSSRESARLDHKADGRSFLAVDVHRGEFGEADDLHTFLVEIASSNGGGLDGPGDR